MSSPKKYAMSIYNIASNNNTNQKHVFLWGHKKNIHLVIIHIWLWSLSVMNDLQHNKYTEISCLCWETMNRMVKKDLVFPQPKFINIYGQYPDVHFDVNARVIAAKKACFKLWCMYASLWWPLTLPGSVIVINVNFNQVFNFSLVSNVNFTLVNYINFTLVSNVELFSHILSHYRDLP